MNRLNKSTIGLCVLAGLLTPLLAGAFAWRYIDESAREGLLYLWLYRLPTVMPEQFIGSTRIGYLVTSLVYTAVYLGIVRAAATAKHAFKTRGRNE